MAGRSRDDVRRSILNDFMLSVPPLADWPTESLDALQEACRYIISLGRLSRELSQLNPASWEGS